MYAPGLARQLKLRPSQVTAVIDLLDAGNSIPFVARYRQEATGGVDESSCARFRMAWPGCGHWTSGAPWLSAPLRSKASSPPI
jgi:hypothetical protein